MLIFFCVFRRLLCLVSSVPVAAVRVERDNQERPLESEIKVGGLAHWEGFHLSMLRVPGGGGGAVIASVQARPCDHRPLASGAHAVPERTGGHARVVT